MYTHDLIENFPYNTIEKSKRSEIYRRLKNSHHFFLDSYQDFFSLCKNIIPTGDAFFQGDSGQNINFPFEDFTIQFKASGRRIILLVSDLSGFEPDIGENAFWVLPFEKENGWFISEYGILVTPSCEDGNVQVFPIIDYDLSTEEYMSLSKSKYTLKTLWSVNTFLMLLNTKNITTIDNTPPAKLNKKRIKNGKQPLFTYKTLRLQLPAKKCKKGSCQATDNTTRLHLCRGHFKTYTAEAPLLGKFTGRYWWQSHARGDKKQGVVMKDYAVKLA